MRRRAAGCLVAVLAAAGALVALTAPSLPPRAVRIEPGPADRRVVRGSLHVHTRRSDGAGTVGEVARAAHDAGLHFVVFTDHGDATRTPDAPAYIEGVLCLDAVEISTTGGHYVALGLPQAPYRLAGEPRDVVEDVARLGGFGIAAHPDSPKPELRWTAWDAGIDGLEWLNGDSAWRDEPALSLLRGFATYWVRAPETIARFLDRDAHVFAEWDRLGRERRVVAIAGHDAHARIALSGNWEPASTDAVVRVPGYASAFDAFAVRARLPRPLTGRASTDADLVLEAVRRGRVFTVIDAFAGPADLQFTVQGDAGTVAQMGDTFDGSGPVRLLAAVTPVPGVRLLLLRDGRIVAQADEPVLEYEHPGGLERAVYRVEAFLQGRGNGLPWIVGNPIYSGPPADLVVSVPLDVAAQEPLSMEPRPGDWLVERAPQCEGRLARAEDGTLVFAWRLSGGDLRGQYAAAVRPLPRGRVQQWNQVAFTAWADAPMRLSVQVRTPSGNRSIRSVYVDRDPREVTVRLDDLHPAEPASASPARLADVDSLLVVADTVNTLPGRAGLVHLRSARLERVARPGQVRTVSSR